MQQVVIVQISDTHFGPCLLNDRFGWVSGYREHDVLLLTRFQAALRDVRIRTQLQVDDEFFVLHSGDVTATGDDGEFACADLYLRGSRPFNFNRLYSANLLGLDLAPSQLAAIPGNHDHWDGKRFRWGPYNQRIFGRYFRSLPWPLTLRSDQLIKTSVDQPPNRVAVELYAVDSNSGMTTESRTASIRAKGRISDEQFTLLDDRLSKPQQPGGHHKVRVFVVHHPFSINSKLPVFAAQPLDSQSVARLIELAAKHKVFAILDGHTHRFSYHTHCALGGAWQLHELRSATTLQGPASDVKQGFIAHQVYVKDGKFVWQAWQYRWDSADFQCTMLPNNQPWWQRPIPE